MFLQVKAVSKLFRIVLDPSFLFVISIMTVNGGNYLYNILLGRKLSPAVFAEAGLLTTLLLVFAFLAMTFQIVSAKFSIEFEGLEVSFFKRWINRLAMNTGVFLCALMLLFHKNVSSFFHLADSLTVIIFAMSLPFYFIMSNYRGFFQGAGKYVHLSASYQVEMWVRFLITFLLISILRVHPSNIIALSISVSIIAGYVILRPKAHFIGSMPDFESAKKVIHFFFLTAGYECAQILINYSDILLVKHYFDGELAGQYTSIALIGRMIYFVTWMLVMILIPKVLTLRKQGKPYKQTLLQYFAVIATFSTFLIVSSLLFPKMIITTLFGATYLPVSHLLWMYGLATMLFALSNLFVYYFLSLDNQRPVYIAIVAGLVQVVLFTIFHKTLEQVLTVQIINMGCLLFLMIGIFIRSK